MGQHTRLEDTKLEPVKFVQLEKRYVSPNYDEKYGMIHIVSYNALSEYLELVRQYYWKAVDEIFYHVIPF
jgi:hypothetical protein